MSGEKLGDYHEGLEEGIKIGKAQAAAEVAEAERRGREKGWDMCKRSLWIEIQGEGYFSDRYAVAKVGPNPYRKECS